MLNRQVDQAFFLCCNLPFDPEKQKDDLGNFAVFLSVQG